jgi:hypothetical protein
MKRFIEGQERAKSISLPERMEDFVDEDNLVGVINVFVDELYWQANGICDRPVWPTLWLGLCWRPISANLAVWGRRHSPSRCHYDHGFETSHKSITPCQTHRPPA